MKIILKVEEYCYNNSFYRNKKLRYGLAVLFVRKQKRYNKPLAHDGQILVPVYGKRDHRKQLPRHQRRILARQKHDGEEQHAQGRILGLVFGEFNADRLPYHRDATVVLLQKSYARKLHHGRVRPRIRIFGRKRRHSRAYRFHRKPQVGGDPRGIRKRDHSRPRSHGLPRRDRYHTKVNKKL